MKIATALTFAACLTLPGAAWSQDAPIKLDLAPLLAALQHKDWFGTSNNPLADAIQAAFSKAQFQSAPGPGPDVLTLSAPDGVKKDRDDFLFTVVFSRDGGRLGEAVESCPMKKLSDCTDQLILDTKTAAQ
ncbi:MAG TPA: hypothetical protein VN723_03725 [Rhizomicrobium sp.]|nr:hypothetical protein [Rhizomicrobium sp.]